MCARMTCPAGAENATRGNTVSLPLSYSMLVPMTGTCTSALSSDSVLPEPPASANPPAETQCEPVGTLADCAATPSEFAVTLTCVQCTTGAIRTARRLRPLCRPPGWYSPD